MSVSFQSINPADGSIVWEGVAADAAAVEAAVARARAAFSTWGFYPLEDRVAVLERFAALVSEHKEAIACLIMRETGKALWDAMGEPTAMAAKVAISIRAYHERTGSRVDETGPVRARLGHKPHGVMAVFGPYNFPAHLPNGHIVPALLAGNTIVFKPSELAPATAEYIAQLWAEAGLPEGVLNVVQGLADTGRALVSNPDIDGILFTGSVPTGKAIAKAVADRPSLILALELGGNNPLIFESADDLEAASLLTIQSAYISAGQRCTCARRLIVPLGEEGDAFLAALMAMMKRIEIGYPDADDAPFMGPLVSTRAAAAVLKTQQMLLDKGAKALVMAEQLDLGPAFLSPGLIDVTTPKDVEDEECFGPLLQVVRVKDFEAAINVANATRFGLAAGIISERQDRYDYFYRLSRAGIVNWNQPLTGASGAAPFGGSGDSGNNRPSAYYAADYCAFPVASLENKENRVTAGALPQGIRKNKP